MERSFNQWLVGVSQQYRQKPAVVFEGGEISYQELEDLTARLVTLMRQKWELKKGDRLAFAFANSPEVVLINYAAWRAGMVTVPLDTTRDTPELKKYKMEFTDCKVLLDEQVLGGFEKFKKEVLECERAEIKNVDIDEDCLILFTSGTTAMPKGVRLTVKNLWSNAESIAEWLRFTPKDRWLVVLPLHHINSTTFVNTTLLSGGSVVLTAKYSKSGFWQTMADMGVTGTSIVPTIAYDQLSEEESFEKLKGKLKQVTRIQIGSAPVQPVTVEKFMAKFGIPLYQGYGQTETALRSTGVPMGLAEADYRRARETNALGTELKHTKVTVLDQKGNEVDEGVLGEICVKGPVIMKGYLKNEAANKEAFAYDWFHSGDTGYWQKIGGKKWFFLQGRSKEIIKKGGVLISPVAIENALLKAYKNLKQVYVVGFADERMGERIGAVAVTDDKKLVGQILADSRNGKVKNLSAYEMIEAMMEIDEEKLPKTSTGKIQRVNLKEMFGGKLKMQAELAGETDEYWFKKLSGEDKDPIKQAQQIDKQRWGSVLGSSLEEFKLRVQNGLVIAAIEKKSGQAVGIVAAVQIKDDKIPRTWSEATAGGKFSNHTVRGNCLVCVAISVKGKDMVMEKERQKEKLTEAKLTAYLDSDQDSVVRFHRKAKGGLGGGAKLIKVIAKGRPEDVDSLGYNILFEYPPLTKKPTINDQASVGVQLIEAALNYAYEKKIKKVWAYSRPADLGKYFS